MEKEYKKAKMEKVPEKVPDHMLEKEETTFVFPLVRETDVLFTAQQILLNQKSNNKFF
jgi:hypothetical protein